MSETSNADNVTLAYQAGWQRFCGINLLAAPGALVPRAETELLARTTARLFEPGAGWAVRLAPVGEIVHHGSASAWRCNHRRDLMLTSGIVRWHRKHRGTLSAAAAYAVLFLFNATRAAFWSVRALFSRDARVKRRRDHFAGVVAGYGAAWPRLAEVRS